MAASRGRRTDRGLLHISVVMLALVSAAGLTGCSEPGVSPSDQSSPSAESSTDQTADAAGPTVDDELLGVVRNALDAATAAAAENAFMISGVRSTASDDGSDQPATTSLDRSETDVAPGRYTLTVFCAGQGSVTATLGLGDDSSSSSELPCGESGASADEIVMERTTPADVMTVSLSPVDGTAAAMAYIVTHG